METLNTSVDGTSLSDHQVGTLTRELREYLVVDKMTGLLGIRHPLLFWPGYEPKQAPEINVRFRAIRRRLSGAFDRRDWAAWVMAHEREYLWDSLICAAQNYNLRGKELAKVFRLVWLDSQAWWERPEEVASVIESIQEDHFRLSLSARERHKLERLKPIGNVVYRGWNRLGDHGPHSYSWTKERSEAEYYARRFCQAGPSPERWPLIATGLANGKDALACFLARDSPEYIIPPAKVRFTSIEVLEQINNQEGGNQEGGNPDGNHQANPRLVKDSDLFTYRENGDTSPIVAWCQIPKTAAAREARNPHIQAHRLLRMALNCGIKIQRMVFARDYQTAIRTNELIQENELSRLARGSGVAAAFKNTAFKKPDTSKKAHQEAVI